MCLCSQTASNPRLSFSSASAKNVCMYVRKDVTPQPIYVCMYVCVYGCVYVCMYVVYVTDTFMCACMCSFIRAYTA